MSVYLYQSSQMVNITREGHQWMSSPANCEVQLSKSSVWSRKEKKSFQNHSIRKDVYAIKELDLQCYHLMENTSASQFLGLIIANLFDLTSSVGGVYKFL